MAISRDDLKKKRLQAMGVVGSQLDASASMYDEITAYSKKVDAARDEAKAAHIGAMNAEIADLKEMAEELSEFAQAAVPTTGGSSGQAQSASTGAPAATTATPSSGSAALNALQNATPGNLSASAWHDGQQIPGTVLK